MKNHRQDQAVLSAFLSNLKTTRSMNVNHQAIPGLRLENKNNLQKCNTLLGNELKTIQNLYQIDVKSSYISREKMRYNRVVAKYSSRSVDKAWNPAV